MLITLVSNYLTNCPINSSGGAEGKPASALFSFRLDHTPLVWSWVAVSITAYAPGQVGGQGARESVCSLLHVTLPLKVNARQTFYVNSTELAHNLQK